MSLATVQDILPTWPGWASMELSYGDQSSGQGSGQTIVKAMRDPHWVLHAESKVLSPNEIRYWKARLSGLDNGRKLFLGYDFTCYYPTNYPHGSWPTGVAFSGTTAAILTVGGDGVSISLSGLPAGYVGWPGDMLAVTYGSGSPAAIQVLQAVESFIVDGAGHSDVFEVRPAIPAGVVAGKSVSVKKPACHMMIAPGSLNIPKDSSARGVISFDAIQVPTP
jgi:hypothetical protein